MTGGAPRSELLRALARFLDPPDEGLAPVAVALGLPLPKAWQHTRAFVELLVPYASVYLGSEGMIGGEARDRIAGFWRVLGTSPPAEPDHLGTLLGAYAGLAELEKEAAGGAAGYRRARQVLLGEHILSWCPLWLDKLARCGPPVYREWARLLGRALAAEEVPASAATGAHLRSVPGLDETTGDAEEELRALLAPARAGFILCRSDLERCARELDLGLRAGERRFALRALLQQGGAAVPAWLADFAAAEARAGREAGVDPTWWRRAERSAAWLRRQAASALR